jgi:sn-glycerol 3-phosphate transport system permease protein
MANEPAEGAEIRADELIEPDPDLPGLVEAGPHTEAPPAAPGRSWVGSITWYVVLSALALVVLLPIWLTLMRALSNPEAAVRPGASPFVPHQIEWDVFRRAIDQGDLWAALFRSLIVTLLITGGQLLTSVLAAYAFAYLRFPFRRIVFAFFMATLLLPIEVTLLPNLHTVRELDWFNSFQGMAVPFMATALGTFLIRQGFLGVPSEIRDATRLEGYGHWAFLWKFAVPLTRPVIASFTVISFLTAYNQYLWPRAVITDTEQWATVQIALRSLTTTPETSNIAVAGALVAALPIVVLLALFSRQIVQGLTAGAVKG